MNTKELIKDSMLYDLVFGFALSSDDYIATILVNDYQNYILNSRIIDKEKLNKYNLIMSLLVQDKKFYNFVCKDYDSISYFIDDTRIYLEKKYNEYFNINEQEPYVSKWI